MKRNMIADDEEYKEPNKLVQGVILAVVTHYQCIGCWRLFISESVMAYEK